MKTKIEDAADKHVEQYDNEPDKSWSRLDFIAGAEFMQDEVERLTEENRALKLNYKDQMVICLRLDIDKLKEQLAVYQMTDNRLVIDYNTLRENLEMERACHDSYIKDLEAQLEMTRLALEDFVLESDHLSSCAYNNGVGYEYECKCMDRRFFNKTKVMIRAKEVLAKLR